MLVSAGLLATRVSSFADTTGAALVQAGILESNVAYLRVGHVAASLPDEVSAATRALIATNPIAGTVLDLRYADGDDAAAAAAIASLFAVKKLPLAILVNSETRGVAVKLAIALRNARAGLVFGTVPAAVRPDVAVVESLADEKKFYENPYAAPATNSLAALAGTNNLLLWVDHTTEADLVRAKIKDGEEDEGPVPVDAYPRFSSPASPNAAESQAPVIHDPVLARAVDLIKGLAIMREAHF
jgi:hypothetical protein